MYVCAPSLPRYVSYMSEVRWSSVFISKVCIYDSMFVGQVLLPPYMGIEEIEGRRGGEYTPCCPYQSLRDKFNYGKVLSC